MNQPQKGKFRAMAIIPLSIIDNCYDCDDGTGGGDCDSCDSDHGGD